MKGKGAGAEGVSLRDALLNWYLKPQSGQVATSPAFRNDTTLRQAGQYALALFIFRGTAELIQES